MKKFNKFFAFTLLVALGLNYSQPGLSQTGNQSDIGGPNPNEISPVFTSPNQQEVTPGEVRNPGEPTSTANLEVDRAQFDANFEAATFTEAVTMVEELQAVEFGNYLGTNFYGETTPTCEIAEKLYELAQETGKNPAIVYVVSLPESLELLLLVPQAEACEQEASPENKATQKASLEQLSELRRKVIPNIKRSQVLQEYEKLVTELTNPVKRRTTSYLKSAQQLYQWLVAPLENELQANNIDTLIFCMDSGLRTIPIAALHDGQQFIIEKYSVALIPSFSLTDTRYVDIRQMPILAMGSSEFDDLPPLPGVPLEIATIVSDGWNTESFLNEQFTLENFKQLNQQERFGIIHLATHGIFNSGSLTNSFIKFWDRRVSLAELGQIAQDLGWHSSGSRPVQMLVLSACETALGDVQAELGFAGLSVKSGVKSSLASLWSVSDIGTLGLMSEFYNHLGTIPIKAEALRQAQLAMLQGKVQIQGNQIQTSNGEVILLSDVLAAQNINLNFTHPYFWSAFAIVGNWN